MRKHYKKQRKKIAVTGGPSGGKTTLIETIRKEFHKEVAIVPEAASILYRGGWPRKKQAFSQLFTQKAIFYTQYELEALVEHDDNSQLVVCDRGSLDGIAYWPQSKKSFFKALKTNSLRECRRYDWVLHLDTASKNGYDSDNPIRIESYEEAQKLNHRVKLAWNDHPRRIIIPPHQDFLSKMAISLQIINLILNEASIKDIEAYALSEGLKVN